MGKETTEKSAQVEEIGKNGNPRATQTIFVDEYDGLKIRLHDRNSQMQEIFRARHANRLARDAWEDSKEQTKELKKDYDETTTYLQRVVDAAESGRHVEASMPEADENGQSDKRSAGSSAKSPTAPAVPAAAAAADTKSEKKTWRDENDIDVLKLAKGRAEKLRAGEVNRIFELEEAIKTGRLQTLKGLGNTSVDAITDAYEGWRKEHPIPAAEDQMTDEECESVRKKAIEDLENQTSEDVLFEELEDEEDGSQEVDDLTNVGADLSPEDEPEFVTDEKLPVKKKRGRPKKNAAPKTEESQENSDHGDVIGQELDTNEAPEFPQRGDDVDELADALANVFCFVPGEIIEGWKPSIRAAIKSWAVDVSDAAEGTGEAPKGVPNQLERFMVKSQMPDPVAFAKKKRGYSA